MGVSYILLACVLRPDNSPLLPVSAPGVPLKGVGHQLHDSPLPHWAGTALWAPASASARHCCALLLLMSLELPGRAQSWALGPRSPLQSWGRPNQAFHPLCKQTEPTVPVACIACLGRKLNMAHPATILLAFRLSASFVTLPVKMRLFTSPFPRKSFHGSLMGL